MANTKEIRNKIKSIQSTQKITRAMEMVAASKMKKAQERMNNSRPYKDSIIDVVNHLLDGSLEYKHAYTIKRDVKGVGYIVISTNRGLCGGLNSNLFKVLLKDIVNYNNKNINNINLSLIGKKSISFFNRFNFHIQSSTTDITDKPDMRKLTAIIKIMLELYNNKKIDILKLVYNEFVNTMIQKPKILQILPIEKNKTKDKSTSWDYIYEPSSKELIDSLIDRFLESLVYQGIVENISCEQAARMVAMKSASDNAGDIIDECRLIYNKERQAAITQELSEIVAGAAAV